MDKFISVVEKFGIKNAKGKKVHVSDHLETRVDSDEELKFLLDSMSENLVLKVHFSCVEKRSSIRDLYTTQVRFLYLIYT